jgi:hypothetical protein
MVTPRVSVDFNAIDQEGCVPLTTLGAQRELKQRGIALEAGMTLRVVGDVLRSAVKVRAPSAEGDWRGELIDGLHNRVKAFPFALIRLTNAIGTDAGIGADLPSESDPCYFECIAWDASRTRRLFAMARIPRRTYRHVTIWLDARVGEHTRSISEVPSEKRIRFDEALSRFRSLLTTPTAMLVFARDAGQQAEKLAYVRDMKGDVARVLAQGTPDDIAMWDGIETWRPHTCDWDKTPPP